MATPSPIQRLAAVLAVLASSAFSFSEAKAENPLDADRAFGYLEAVCELGPRPSGSRAMIQQVELLKSHFESLGAEVELQPFRARNPRGGSVRMKNLIARYHPEAKRRLILCCHYDTRPLPSRDPNPQARRNGTFIGANDGGSGVAVLMELAHLMPRLSGAVGVDLVMFDGEELVYRDPQSAFDRGDPYFLGSIYFARDYRAKKKGYRYEAGVLLDMVGDADLQLYYEKNSWSSRGSREVVRGLWETAARLGVEEFVPRSKHTVRDDHLPLNQAGIPTCDVIDFDYPHWHTEQDVPENCSGESLAKVGWVVWEWVKEKDASGASDSNEGSSP